MLEEADEVLEDWFAGGAEQATLLRLLANVTASSDVVEIGCGLGRLAFALRRNIDTGSYLGFDVAKHKIEFLTRTLGARASNFEFQWVDFTNMSYNPCGASLRDWKPLPRRESSADAVVAMAVFTHLLPEQIEWYFAESARLLRPGGHMLLSCYLAENYDSKHVRPPRYRDAAFEFSYATGLEGCLASDVDLVESMLAVPLSFLLSTAERHGLTAARSPLMGSWSGATVDWVSGQDLVVLSRARP